MNPTEVDNWNVRLVGIDDGQRTNVRQARFDGRFNFRLTPAQRTRYGPYDRIVAIVAYDEPTELVQQYASYTLTVNGVLQPGG